MFIDIQNCYSKAKFDTIIIKKEVYEKKELNPIYDSRKSFYGKAKVHEIYILTESEKEKANLKKIKFLLSYDTPVCYILDKEVCVYAPSSTTNRHIREFLKQNNLDISDYRGTGKYILVNNRVKKL